MRVLFSLLLLVATALAYQVTSPNNSSGWTTAGPNTVVWSRVDTDPSTFAIFLTNVNNGGNSGNSLLLNSNVDGTLGTLVVNAPSGGWVPGSGYRVNFAQDSTHPDSLLAQSPQFTITSSSTTQSGSSTTSGSTGSTQSGTGTVTGTATGTSTGTAAVNSATSSLSSSATSTTPTGTNAALRADTPAGFLTAVAAVAAFFTALF